MDMRHGKRHNFITEIATSIGGEVQPSARQRSSFSAGQIFPQVWQLQVPGVGERGPVHYETEIHPSSWVSASAGLLLHEIAQALVS